MSVITHKITMTTLLREPSKVKMLVGKGFRVLVYSDNELVFEITAPKNQPETKINKGFKNRPVAKLNFPTKVTKQDLYEKFSAK